MYMCTLHCICQSLWSQWHVVHPWPYTVATYMPVSTTFNHHCQAGALQEGLLCKMCPTTSCYSVLFSASPLQPLEMQGIILFIYFGLVGYIRTCTVLTKHLCLSPLSHYVISTMLSLADMDHRRSVLLSQCVCISVDNYIYVM